MSEADGEIRCPDSVLGKEEKNLAVSGTGALLEVAGTEIRVFVLELVEVKLGPVFRNRLAEDGLGRRPALNETDVFLSKKNGRVTIQLIFYRIAFNEDS